MGLPCRNCSTRLLPPLSDCVAVPVFLPAPPASDGHLPVPRGIWVWACGVTTLTPEMGVNQSYFHVGAYINYGPVWILQLG
jgi:hypothetical protein